VFGPPRLFFHNFSNWTLQKSNFTMLRATIFSTPATALARQAMYTPARLMSVAGTGFKAREEAIENQYFRQVRRRQY
jgi:hypothetical protein